MRFQGGGDEEGSGGGEGREQEGRVGEGGGGEWGTGEEGQEVKPDNPGA